MKCKGHFPFYFLFLLQSSLQLPTKGLFDMLYLSYLHLSILGNRFSFLFLYLCYTIFLFPYPFPSQNLTVYNSIPLFSSLSFYQSPRFLSLPNNWVKVAKTLPWATDSLSSNKENRYFWKGDGA